jgi:isocitrate dehydrogenase
MSNRGVKVYPEGFPETHMGEQFRCRFQSTSGGAVSNPQIIGLLQRINQTGLEFVKLENLCTFDGERGYSLGQGE